MTHLIASLPSMAMLVHSNNANYLGPATPDELALQIAQAVGPSGPNWEYVARLADAMRSVRACLLCH